MSKLMKLQDLHGVSGFVVSDVSFRQLCNCIAELPGVVFTDRRRFFLGSERAEFTFHGHTFTITCDGDGDYWVQPKDERNSPPEVEEIRKHVAQSVMLRKRWIDRLLSKELF